MLFGCGLIWFWCDMVTPPGRCQKRRGSPWRQSPPPRPPCPWSSSWRRWSWCPPWTPPPSPRTRCPGVPHCRCSLQDRIHSPLKRNSIFTCGYAGIGADHFVFSNSLDSSPIVQNDAKLLKENIPTDVYGAMMIIKTLMTRHRQYHRPSVTSFNKLWPVVPRCDLYDQI